MEGLNFLQNLQSSSLNHEKKISDLKGMISAKLCKVLHQIINLFFQSSRLQFCSCKVNLHKMIHVKICSDLKGLVKAAIANSDLIFSLMMLSSKNNLLGILRSRWQWSKSLCFIRKCQHKIGKSCCKKQLWWRRHLSAANSLVAYLGFVSCPTTFVLSWSSRNFLVLKKSCLSFMNSFSFSSLAVVNKLNEPPFFTPRF